MRYLPHFQRRSYNSTYHQPHGNPNILPYTFMAICCAGCAFANYARTTHPQLLPLIDRHAVCSLQNIREGRYHTMLTSSLTHFSPIHLAANMFGLSQLGPLMVTAFGPSGFLVLWVGGSLACDTATLYWERMLQQADGAGAQSRTMKGIRPEQTVETKAVGASGSVLGMLAVFGCRMPKHRIIVFPLPIPMPAWLAIGSFAVGSVYCAVNVLLPFIGHAGHLGGMAFGTAYYYTWGRRYLKRLRGFWSARIAAVGNSTTFGSFRGGIMRYC